MRKRILVVDDEPHIQRSLETRLLDAGYFVTTASSGEEAFIHYQSSLKETAFSLILLDIIMPGMSGLEVLEQIRSDERERCINDDSKVPIIMLSALKDSWKDEALREGCNDFVTKPYDGHDLLEKINRIVSVGKISSS